MKTTIAVGWWSHRHTPHQQCSTIPSLTPCCCWATLHDIFLVEADGPKKIKFLPNFEVNEELDVPLSDHCCQPLQAHALAENGTLGCLTSQCLAKNFKPAWHSSLNKQRRCIEIFPANVIPRYCVHVYCQLTHTLNLVGSFKFISLTS